MTVSDGSGKFIRIKCIDCGNEQLSFSKPSTNVVCNVCGSTLIRPSGGRGELKGELLEVVE